MLVPGGAWLRKRPCTPSGFTRGPSRLGIASSQVHRCLIFQRDFPLPSCYFFFYPFIYRGQESFTARRIPTDIMWWISIRRINSGFVCRIYPHKYTDLKQGNISSTEISSCCLFALKKEKGTEWKSEIRPIFHKELWHHCSVVFFYRY